MRKNLASVILLLFLFLFTNNVNAETGIIFPEVSDGKINEAIAKTTHIRFLPSNPIYFTITLKEYFGRLFQPSASRRAEFDFILSSKRLKEAYLLLEQNNSKDASVALNKYSDRLDLMLKQISKARSQNQSMEPIFDEIADCFNYQEILFFAVSKKNTNNQLTEESFDGAKLSFMNAINTIDSFRPGFRNRYKSAKNFAILKSKQTGQDSPSNYPNVTEATPSANPKRIIY